MKLVRKRKVMVPLVWGVVGRATPFTNAFMMSSSAMARTWG